MLVQALSEGVTPQTVSFGSSSAAFFMEPITDKMLGEPLSVLSVPKGYSLFGLLHENGQLELAGDLSIQVQAGDQLVCSQLVD